MTQVLNQLDKLSKIKTAIKNAVKSKNIDCTLAESPNAVEQLGKNKSQIYNIHSNTYFGQIKNDGSIDFTCSLGDVIFSNVKDIAPYALYGKLAYKKIDSLSFPMLEKISGDYACKYAVYVSSGINSVTFPALQEITGEEACMFMFNYSGIKNVSFPLLEHVLGESACNSMFEECKSLENCSFDSMVEIGGSYSCRSMFSMCEKLTNTGFSKLQKITGDNTCSGMYSECNELTSTGLDSLLLVDGKSVCSGMFECTGKFTTTGLNNLKSISGNYACSYMFCCYPSYSSTLKDTPLSDIALTSLETIDGQYAVQYMFYNRNNIINAVFPKLKSINGSACCGSMFAYCRGLNTISFPVLESIIGERAFTSICYQCTSLENVYFDSLHTIDGKTAFTVAFKGCTNLKRIDFPKLTNISAKAFVGSSSIYDAFVDCAALTEIHFRYDVEHIVTALDGYSTKWGAENATIYFDLGCSELEITPTPSDATVKFYDAEGTEIPNPTVTEVSKYAWSVGGEVFYTDNEAPSVGDEVYDSEGNLMTQKVTSISDNTITIG